MLEYRHNMYTYVYIYQYKEQQEFEMQPGILKVFLFSPKIPLTVTGGSEPWVAQEKATISEQKATDEGELTETKATMAEDIKYKKDHNEWE